MSEPSSTASDPASPVAGPPATGDSRRGMGSAADMVRSLVLIIAVVAVLLLIVPRPSGRPVARVDVAQAATAAAGQLGFTPVVPENLPAGWTAVTAEVETATGNTPTWHLSYLTPSGEYAGVQEAAHPSLAWEAKQVTDGGTNQGNHVVAGQTFLVRSRTDRGITSWVLRGPARTTIITGTAQAAELDQFATAIFG